MLNAELYSGKINWQKENKYTYSRSGMFDLKERNNANIYFSFFFKSFIKINIWSNMKKKVGG